MSIQFSESTNNSGIVQQVRSLIKADANQWPTYKIVNSCNNWLDFVAGYYIASDKRFSWDDTNHSKLPEGKTDLVSGQSDYSFLTDEQGNTILTLTGVSLIDSSNKETPLEIVDRTESSYDSTSFGVMNGTPTAYDKIADNIIRLNYKPSATDASTYDLKFYFQRTPSYFITTDTTKTPGVSPLLHRGFVIASAYDGALTLGKANLQPLSVERQNEIDKVIKFFEIRGKDDTKKIMRPKKILYI